MRKLTSFTGCKCAVYQEGSYVIVSEFTEVIESRACRTVIVGTLQCLFLAAFQKSEVLVAESKSYLGAKIIISFLNGSLAKTFACLLEMFC